jgi:hypothetical protein
MRRAGQVSLFLVGGGAVGYLYHLIVGCPFGGCLIAGNPYIATGYGALFGYVISLRYRAPARVAPICSARAR